ncbi:thiamine pyrophosphate-binding protein [Microbacterium protaetiae]|uniref:thiamine pyrophosphate-binding protein n=1 Tax=Microbacterium protaetiae TaxID=2509458 RepID=UPI001F5DE549|nr:thiamine pyrophosphate-binding protein [Microbacterium protaetiae]
MDAAAALLTRLVDGGVRHIVLSPGSRSQALALVSAELERRGRISLHVRIDERVAGFTALGIGRESGMPAAVVCTSGTATANLLPAVMEADHAGVPLLLLTADRPPELRGIGANQTTRQSGMFAAHARWSTELDTPSGAPGESDAVRDAADAALAAALGAPHGPVHLNLPYREPLSGALGAAALDGAAAGAPLGDAPFVETRDSSRNPGPRPVSGRESPVSARVEDASARAEGASAGKQRPGDAGAAQAEPPVERASAAGAAPALGAPLAGAPLAGAPFVETGDSSRNPGPGPVSRRESLVSAGAAQAEPPVERVSAAGAAPALGAPLAGAPFVETGDSSRNPGPRPVSGRESLVSAGAEGASVGEARTGHASAGAEGASAGAARPGPAGAAQAGSPAIALPRGPRTIVIAGADAGPAAEQLAHDGSWPLVAEIVSGARFGRHLVHGYRALLRESALGGRIQRAVVFGHPTLSREVTALLQRRDIEVIAVDGPGERLNLNGATAAAASLTVGDGAADRVWLGEWMRASRAQVVDFDPPAPDAAGMASAVPAEHLAAISAEVAALRTPLNRELLVDAVWRATWPHDRLVFGSSRLVRVADDILPGKKVPVHANRGLAGIDGTIATATGIAVGSLDVGVTRVLLGDLALLHDVGALLLPDDEPAPRLQVIVGNDGGGTIFDGLEVAATADQAALRRVLYTPQQVELARLADAYGWEYQRATTRSALDQALSAATERPQLIEVPLDR